uniref:Uncharacterized protein n=1 Tax=Anguilla anguilla TaxID=7936 RepID=A0A0E9S5A4_ANGAN
MSFKYVQDYCKGSVLLTCIEL